MADFVFGAATIFLGLFILWGARTLPRGVLSYALDPALFPHIVALGLVILGSLLILQSLRGTRSKEVSPSPSAARLVFLILATVAYIALWGRGSFLLNTSIYLFGIQYIMKAKPLSALLSSVLISVGVYLLFTRIFQVRLF